MATIYSNHEAMAEIYSNDIDVDRLNEQDRGILEGPSLLCLCNDEKYRQADRRFDLLIAEQEHSKLESEIFEVSCEDGTNAVMEMLAGSDLGDFAIYKWLCYAQDRYPAKLRHLLSLQPQHGKQRTALHWACLSNLVGKLHYKLLVHACPEALLLRDDGNRTPVDLLELMSCREPVRYGLEENLKKLHYLQRQAHRWHAHRIRDTLYIGAQRLFSTATIGQDGKTLTLTPFCDKDRKTTKMMRRQWFIISVLGSLMQREMRPLAWHILEYVNAVVPTKKKRNAKQGNSNNQKRKRT